MPGRTQPLVSQYLEGVSRKALEKYRDVVQEFVRGRNGIYALYRGGKLYYVGLARNLRSRLKDHLDDRHARLWDSFSVYLTIGESLLPQLEALVVRVASPQGNLQKGRFGRADNLTGRFRTAVRERMDREGKSLFWTRPKRSSEAEKVGDRKLELARYLTKPIRLRLRCKGKQYTARARTDGWIRMAGRLYRTPSAAAVAIFRRPMNGWVAWLFERAPGDWVPLATLRK